MGSTHLRRPSRERIVEAFVEQLDLREMGFEDTDPLATGRPAYHPLDHVENLRLRYLNRIQLARRLEHETPRSVELMWLTGRLAPDFKTIANFRKDNGSAIRKVCRQFIVLCRQLMSAKPIYADTGRHRRQQVQGSEQPRRELYRRENEAAYGAGQREHRALSAGDGHRRSCGARSSGVEEGPTAHNISLDLWDHCKGTMDRYVPCR